MAHPSAAQGLFSFPLTIVLLAVFGSLGALAAGGLGNSQSDSHDLGQVSVPTTVFADGFETVPVQTEHCGLISADENWPLTDEDHRVTCDLEVHAQLTIEDGVTVRVEPGVSVNVGRFAAGSLRVDGSVSGTVITSSQTNPIPGDWDALRIGPLGDASIAGTTLEYCGANGACLEVDGGTLHRLEGSMVRLSAGDGVFAGGNAVISIRESFIANNVGTGLTVLAPARLHDPSYAPSFVANALVGNGEYPAVLPPGSVDELDVTSNFVGNGQDYVAVSAGGINQDVAWRPLDAPYLVSGDIRVEGLLEPVMHVEAGTTIYFQPGTELVVGENGPGGLIAVGAPHLPILFSALDQSSGAWGGMRLGSNCQADSVILTHTIIEFGGANGLGNVVWQSCDGQIASSTVSDSEAWGIYRDSATPTITDITYANNTLGNLY